MVMGRKPKSTASARLDGSIRRSRKRNDAEPVHPPAPDAFDAVPPELTGAAAAEWTRLAPLLRRARQINEADRTCLVALCIEWSRYVDATNKVQVSGLVVKTPNGYPMVNPYLGIASTALKACNRLWPELGLTPSSRSRVQADGPPLGGDEFSEFDTPMPTFETRKH